MTSSVTPNARELDRTKRDESARCNFGHCCKGPSYSRGLLPINETGRPARYCTEACKQADYRDRKAIAERQRQRDELAAQMKARFESLVDLVYKEMAAFPETRSMQGIDARKFATAVAASVSQQRFPL